MRLSPTQQVELTAQIAHGVARELQELMSETEQPTWNDLAGTEKDALRTAVRAYINDPKATLETAIPNLGELSGDDLVLARLLRATTIAVREALAGVRL